MKPIQALSVGCALALVGASCSSGAAKRSVPTTSNASVASAVAGLGPCPYAYPAIAMNPLNMGVAGVDKKLVPITATAVRVCAYQGDAGLAGHAVLSGRGARDLESEANRGATVSPSGATAMLGCGPLRSPSFYITFANGAQSVDITSAACEYTTNGSLDGGFSVSPDELERLIGKVSVPDVVGKSGADSQVLLSELGLVVTRTGARCCVAVEVVAQDPPAGTLVSRRGTVSITLAHAGGAA